MKNNVKAEAIIAIDKFSSKKKKVGIRKDGSPIMQEGFGFIRTSKHALSKLSKEQLEVLERVKERNKKVS